MQDEEDRVFSISAGTAADYTTTLFIELVMALQKKGVLSAREFGEALLKSANDPGESDREFVLTALLRALGKGLTQTEPDEP